MKLLDVSTVFGTSVCFGASLTLDFDSVEEIEFIELGRLKVTRFFPAALPSFGLVTAGATPDVVIGDVFTLVVNVVELRVA